MFTKDSRVLTLITICFSGQRRISNEPGSPPYISDTTSNIFLGTMSASQTLAAQWWSQIYLISVLEFYDRYLEFEELNQPWQSQDPASLSKKNKKVDEGQFLGADSLCMKIGSKVIPSFPFFPFSWLRFNLKFLTLSLIFMQYFNLNSTRIFDSMTSLWKTKVFHLLILVTQISKDMWFLDFLLDLNKVESIQINPAKFVVDQFLPDIKTMLVGQNLPSSSL